MRILITGGAGFIGSHLTDRLVSDGHQVTILDNLATGSRANLAAHLGSDQVEFIEGSILDIGLVDQLVEKSEYIFHLAAAVGVFNIVNHPLDSMLTNIRGTENVLAAADKFKKPVFVTSSSEVYGKNAADSLSETDDRILGAPTTLRWSYSEAKAIDESLAYAYWVEKKLETRTVRFFNTVGPRQLGAYGMVVPRFVQSALNNEPITIYGTGEQTRCFGHVADVIDAVIKIAFAQNTIGKVINIGNDFEISINDLAKKVIAQTNSKSEIVYVAYEEAYGDSYEDMERRVPNIDLIKSLVGWTPTRDLTTIIADLANYLSESELAKQN
jgi:UDP-glucose 4-epimerase